MAKYHLTEKAINDLDDIWEHTVDKWSEEQADIYYRSLLGDCQFLAENPNLGKGYDVVFKGLKGFKSKRHIIFYLKKDESSITIARILHGSMDIKSKLKE